MDLNKFGPQDRVGSIPFVRDLDSKPQGNAIVLKRVQRNGAFELFLINQLNLLSRKPPLRGGSFEYQQHIFGEARKLLCV